MQYKLCTETNFGKANKNFCTEVAMCCVSFRYNILGQNAKKNISFQQRLVEVFARGLVSVSLINELNSIFLDIAQR